MTYLQETSHNLKLSYLNAYPAGEMHSKRTRSIEMTNLKLNPISGKINIKHLLPSWEGDMIDLFDPENSCRLRVKPEGDMIFLGGTHLYVPRLTGHFIVYYT